MNRTWHLPSTFDSLRNLYFRWLWLGRMASSATFQMGTVAQGWLVYQLTGSALALGYVGAGGSIATLLFSLYGGVICDRVSKRNLLLFARTAMGINTLIIGILISLGQIRIWHLVVNSILSGILFSFIMPAEQSIVSDLVDRSTLLNAFSLNSVGMGLMGILSSAGAGLIIEYLGVQGAYYLMALFYLWAVFTLSHLPATGQGGIQTTSIWSDFIGGLKYLFHSPTLLALLGLALARVLFAMPYRTFMPKFARDVMGFEASGLGLLMSAPGLGGLASSLALASLGDYRDKGKLLLGAGVIGGIALIVFVSTGNLPLVLIMLTLVGITENTCMVMNSTLIQAHCESQFRGRIVSVYLMTWGLTPLGSLPAGAIADRFGVPVVVGIQGLLLVLSFGLLWYKSSVKDLQ